MRESRGLYDSRIEVWLDAGRDFMPSRVLMDNGAEAQALELVLRARDADPAVAAGEADRPASAALAFRRDGPK